MIDVRVSRGAGELDLEGDDAAVAGLDDEIGFVPSPGRAEMPDACLVVLCVDT